MFYTLAQVVWLPHMLMVCHWSTGVLEQNFTPDAPHFTKKLVTPVYGMDLTFDAMIYGHFPPGHVPPGHLPPGVGHLPLPFL